LSKQDGRTRLTISHNQLNNVTAEKRKRIHNRALTLIHS
jgi:hypothetical protein